MTSKPPRHRHGRWIVTWGVRGAPWKLLGHWHGRWIVIFAAPRASKSVQDEIVEPQHTSMSHHGTLPATDKADGSWFGVLRGAPWEFWDTDKDDGLWFGKPQEPPRAFKNSLWSPRTLKEAIRHSILSLRQAPREPKVFPTSFQRRSHQSERGGMRGAVE